MNSYSSFLPGATAALILRRCHHAFGAPVDLIGEGSLEDFVVDFGELLQIGRHGAGPLRFEFFEAPVGEFIHTS